MFKEAFLRRYFTRKLWEAKVSEFLSLKKESMIIYEYNLMFTQLAVMPRKLLRILGVGWVCFFVLSLLSSQDDTTAILIGEMDIPRLMIHVQMVEENKVRDREELWNKNAKTFGNEFGQLKSNANQASFYQKQK